MVPIVLSLLATACDRVPYPFRGGGGGNATENTTEPVDESGSQPTTENSSASDVEQASGDEQTSDATNDSDGEKQSGRKNEKQSGSRKESDAPRRRPVVSLPDKATTSTTSPRSTTSTADGGERPDITDPTDDTTTTTRASGDKVTTVPATDEQTTTTATEPDNPLIVSLPDDSPTSTIKGDARPDVTIPDEDATTTTKAPVKAPTTLPTTERTTTTKRTTTTEQTTTTATEPDNPLIVSLPDKPAPPSTAVETTTTTTRPDDPTTRPTTPETTSTTAAEPDAPTTPPSSVETTTTTAAEPDDPPPGPGEDASNTGAADAPAWSDPSTWPNGRVPAAGQHVTIPASMKVRLDQDVKVGGMLIEGDLYLDPVRSIQLDSTANIVLKGRLVMMPDDASIRHDLRFVGVNESAFKGGGMTVMDSDVGLWVMGPGRLMTQGASKRGWTNANGSVAAGSSRITVRDASGWRVGDEIVIAPTARPGTDSNGARRAMTYDGFHEAEITAVDGNTVSFNPATTKSHPEINGKWTAEVMNLSRNVIIRGEDANHKSHIFVHSDSPQFVRYTELTNLAPGQVSSDGIDATGEKLGRYGLHFHHSGNGTQGSIVEGVTLHRFGSHGFVPHMSHGITFYDVVAYDGGNTPYWWDQGDDSNDILWDRTIGARSRAVDGMFFLGNGQNIEVRNSVAVGGVYKFNTGGFKWDNHGGSWEFNNNIAHNIFGDGANIWQNTNEEHVLQGFDVYHVTGEGISLGAYTNNYHFKDFEIFAPGFDAFGIRVTPRSKEKSSAEPPSVVLERGVIDGGDSSKRSSISLTHSAVPGQYPIQIRDVVIKGRAAQTEAAIAMETRANSKKVDLVDVRIEPGPTPDFRLSNGTATGEGDGESWIRVQNGNEAFRLRPQDQNRDAGATFASNWNAWKKSIAPFRPTTAGDGVGLQLELFDDVGLTDKVYTGIEPYVYVHEEDEPVYHKMSGTTVAARFTGQVQAQQTGTYSFRVGGDRARLWVNGSKIVDYWGGSGGNTGTISLKAGQKYDIRLEVAGPRQPFHADLVWKQPDYPVEQWVPQSQLYLPGGAVTVPFTANDPVPAAAPTFN